MNSFPELKEVIDWRLERKIIIYTQGVFDNFHLGHMSFLNKAKDYGNKLIVGIDSDDKVKKRKGINRPYQRYSDRFSFICGLQIVDVVIKKDIAPKWTYLKMVSPDIWVVSKGMYTYQDICQARKLIGCEIIEIPRTRNISTTILQAKKV